MQQTLEHSPLRKKSLWASHGWLILVVAMVILIAVTRFVSLMHNAPIHLDEATFYKSARSIFTEDYTFKPTDPYPNGGFVFFMPAQFMARAIGEKAGIDWLQTSQRYDRIASVLYFSLACVLAMVLIRRLTKDNRLCLLLYALLAVFALIHIEQSRYGTPESISLLLTALILLLTQACLRERSLSTLLFVAFFAGVITALKFSLVLYLYFPLMLIFSDRTLSGLDKFKRVCYMLMAFLAGLLLFSPAFFEKPGFFAETFFTEFGPYFSDFNPYGYGTPLDNVAGTLLESLLYADMPLAFVFAVIGYIALRKQRFPAFSREPLFLVHVPIFILLFFALNMMATTFFFRSIYPLFFLMQLYTVIGVYTVLRAPRRKWLTVLTGALLALMVVRGAMFVGVLAQPDDTARATQIMTEHEQWPQRSRTTTLGKNFAFAIEDDTFAYLEEEFVTKGQVRLDYGEFGLSGTMDYCTYLRPFHTPWSNAWEAMRTNWLAFKEENAPYLIGSTGSAWQTGLFGSWVHGSTLGYFELPRLYLYYKDHQATLPDDWEDIREQYLALRREEHANTYLAEVREIGSAVLMVVVTGGDNDAFAAITDALPAFGLEPDQVYEQGLCYVAIADGQAYLEEAADEDIEVNLEEFFPLLTNSRLASRTDGDAELLIRGRTYPVAPNRANLILYDFELDAVQDQASLVMDPSTGECLLVRD